MIRGRPLGERRAAPLGALVLLALVSLVPNLGRAEVPARADGLQIETAVRVPLRRASLRGHVERRTFTLRGVPLRGAFEAAVVDDETGASRTVSARAATSAPDVDPAQAEIEAEELPDRVADVLGESGPVRFERAPQLVYRLTFGVPVLAWEIQLPLRRKPEVSRKTLWLSAMSGRLLGEREQVRSARARVFPENPSKTPEAIEVELPGLDGVVEGDPLAGARVVAFNCVDEAPDEPPAWVDEGECYPGHVAVANADGDFFVPLPDVVVEADNVRPADAYSELSMYYHGARFLELMADRGLEEFKCELATMLANWRDLEPTSDFDYTPINNAFWTNQCDPELGMAMLFGQGAGVDFSFDGDVVYHELGHGVVSLLTPEGLTDRRLRPDASVVDAGAINEAIADYFSYIGTDDPRVAEYVGRFWSSSASAQIRTGENQKRCPDDTVGQVHNDGEPVGAALWTARRQIGPALDPVVLEALTRLPVDATLEEAGAAFLEVASELRDEGSLSAQDVEILDRALSTRGLLDCPRVVGDELATSGRTMHLRRRTSVVQPFYPGPMQLRYEVPPGVDTVYVSYTLRGREGENPADDPGAVVLVRRADNPITFTYRLVDADDPGDSTEEVGRIREVTLVEGDWDLELQADLLEDTTYIAPLSNVREGEILHLALASMSEGDLVASDVKVLSHHYVPPAAGDSDVGSSSGGDAEPTADRVAGVGPTVGGCGCTSARRVHPAAPMALFVLGLCAVRRRRRNA